MRLRATITSAVTSTVDVLTGEIDEGLSVPSRAVVTVQTADQVGEDALGTKAHITLTPDTGPARTMHFVIGAVRATNLDEGAFEYQLELWHPLQTLALRQDTRTFQDKDTKEIVQAVLSDAGFSAADVAFQLTGSLGKRPLCVQYNETDFDFVSRLLEEEGIYYTCPDDDDAPKLRLEDSTSSRPAISGQSTLHFSFENEGMGIDEMAIEYRVTPDAVALADYNYETPGVDLTSRSKLDDSPAGEVFEYPGRFETQADGARFAKIRAEELASQKTIATGSADCVALAAGHWFELESAQGHARTGKYLVRSVTHQIQRGTGYRCSFVASPFDLPYRPARKARRPHALGVTTMTVTGPSGQEIHTDKLGRMKGLYAWDRMGKTDDTCSPFLRVLQPQLAGGLTLARVGWEMSVRHMDGDPDRPVAVARMVDGEHPSPEALPANATKTAFGTLSSPRGEKENALIIDDKSGAMLMALKAAKDLDATVLHDETETITANDALTVKKDQTLVIGDAQKLKVDKNNSTTVEKDAGLAVAGARKKTVSKDETVNVDGALSVRIDGNDEESVGADLALTVDKELLETTVGAYEATITGSRTASCAKDYVVYIAGKNSETVGGAKKVASDGIVTSATTGKLTITIGGASAEKSGGNFVTSTQGASESTIGAVASLTATGKLQIKAKKIKMTIAAAGTFVGGAGTVSVTPASITLLGLVTLKGSQGVEITGAPQMAG
jgi:type VI secretion system secreted protein VgrG